MTVPVVAGRRAEVGDVADRNPQALSHECRKRLRKPRTQREDERSRGNAVARTGLERVKPTAGDGSGAGPRSLDASAFSAEDLHHRLDRPSGPDHPGVVLVERHRHAGHVDHGPAPGHLVRVQHVVADAGLVPVPPRVRHEVGPLVSDDQVRRGEEHAGKQHVAPTLVPLVPLLDRPLGPARPEQAVGAVAVAGSDAPRLAPGGRARVGRPVLVQQHDRGSGPLQMKGRPSAEGPGAHHRNVGRLGAANREGIGAPPAAMARVGSSRGFGGCCNSGLGAGQERPRGRRRRTQESPAVERLHVPFSVGAMRTCRIGESAASSTDPGAWPFMRRMYDTTSR